MIRVLVIDDSAYNRQTITSMLSGVADIEVVGRAGDGNEGLKQVFDKEPDVITLDLEMPRMDGFTFLRILMSRRPTPVIVISSHSKQENVFKALELGALDFIAKPTHHVSPELRTIEQELVNKLRLLGQLRRVSLTGRPATPTPVPPADTERAPAAAGPMRVVCIGASTGGPPALKDVLAAIPAHTQVAMVISQHMPPTFTRAFAERLDRGSSLSVREAQEGDRVRPGVCLVAPGSGSISFQRDSAGDVRVSIEPAPATPDDARGRYVPSIDRMLTSAAEVFGGECMAVILTGMGDDGREGIVAVKEAGGVTVAESADTAVIFGMPEEAIGTGCVDEVLPLPRIAEAILRYASGTLR